MMRYDRQAQYWEEALRSIEQGRTIESPLIESQWICHPDANSGKRDSAAQQVRGASFRKTFGLRQLPSSANVQMIGDTQVRLRVNGTDVGELYARRSPSLVVEHQRVKIWDIASLLHIGDNTIRVEAMNYDRFGSAGVNIYAELKTGSELTKILSDATWEVAKDIAGPVDINSADAKTLARERQGIGQAKAEAIVSYREKNGPFKNGEDLAKVKGVGKKLVDQNKANLKFETAKAGG